MATNQMRREAAKRKLASQQARRAQQAAPAAPDRRDQLGGGRRGVPWPSWRCPRSAAAATAARGSAAPSDAASATSAAAQPAASGPGTCAYPSDGNAAKPNTPPPTEGVSNEGTVSVDAGHVGRSDRRHAGPRRGAVHGATASLSLAGQGFFDGTACHRLTTGEGLKVLQCGDPTGTGQRRPGLHDPGRDADRPGRGAVGPAAP